MDALWYPISIVQEAEAIRVAAPGSDASPPPPPSDQDGQDGDQDSSSRRRQDADPRGGPNAGEAVWIPNWWGGATFASVKR